MKSSRVESWVRMGNGYESLYYISNQGRIVNIKTGLEENRNHAPRVRLRNRMGVEFDYDVSSLVSSNFKPGVIGFMWGYEGKEKWREIPGYNGRYKVSNLGRVIGKDKKGRDKLLQGKIVALFDTFNNKAKWDRDNLVSIVFDNHTWVDIPGYKGSYQICKEGLIKSLNYKGSGQPRILQSNFEIILTNRNGYRKKYTIESLLQRTFKSKVKRLPGEEFKFIPGYEGKYMISNKGRVLAKNYKGGKFERILSQSKPGQIVLDGKFYSIKKLQEKLF